ncbi:hypothetical protein CO2235_MP90049 [Cupriavidus oxalaticus]|uniref:Uncharacterized protein n=1 Tax=Cupriavidus oxalaticus TaxID=96344 RepID=A0A375GNW3_9BURK|nr:hypothetical protein CO2235_MP90049 [Cupriavidus oxalaticus]
MRRGTSQRPTVCSPLPQAGEGRKQTLFKYLR